MHIVRRIIHFDMPNLAESFVEENADNRHIIINEFKHALILLSGALSYINNSINILRCYRARDSPTGGISWITGNCDR